MVAQPDEHCLLQTLMNIRQELETAELKVTSLKTSEKEAEERLLSYLENADLQGFKSTLCNASAERKEDLKVSIPEEKKDEAFTFIDEELGRGDAIKTVKQIHWKTLTSLIGNRFKKGEFIPKDSFNVFWKKSIEIKSLN